MHGEKQSMNRQAVNPCHDTATTHCQLSPVDYRLITTHCRLSTVHYPLLILFALLLLASGCRKESTVTPAPPGADTTSHDWVFDPPILLGVNPSYLTDVVIVDDTLAYIAGRIHQNDSTGIQDPNAYNLMRWTPRGVECMRLQYYTGGDTTIPTGSYPSTSVVAFGAADIWVGGESQVARFDGQRQTRDWNIPVSPTRLWGTSSSNLYAVGAIGRIAHYDGHAWTQMASGTGTGLRDITASPDGSVVWASGYTPNGGPSVLLRLIGGQWETLWSANLTVVPPYGYNVASVWTGGKELFVSSGVAVYRSPLSDIHAAERLSSFVYGPVHLRGSAENNIAGACGDGSIWHYNGASWKQILVGQYSNPLYAIAVTDHLIIAVGAQAADGLVGGLITIARRK